MSEYIETANEQDPNGPPISLHHLREHARAAAKSWAVIRRPSGKDAFPARVEAAKLALDDLYAELKRMPPPDYSKITGPDPILTLRENPRLLRGTLRETPSLKRVLPRLPRIAAHSAETPSNQRESQGEVPRASAVAAAYFDSTNSIWHPDAFKAYLDQLQMEEPLDLDELSALPVF